MSLKAVVFDFDGTLVDSEPAHFQALLRTAEPYGLHFDFETYKKLVLGLDDRDSLSILLKGKVSDSEIIELVEVKAGHFANLAPDLSHLQNGAAAFVSKLLDSGIRIAVASGALRQDIDLLFTKLGGPTFGAQFESITSAGEVPHSKPDPALYRLALKRMGLEASQCLAFEDTVVGLKAARAAGLFAVAVTHTMPAETLAPFADQVVSGFSALSAAQLHAWMAAR